MSDVIIVSWPVGHDICYGLVTNESYPNVFGYGTDIKMARVGKKLGSDFVNTLGVTEDLNLLESFEEVEDE